MGLLKRLYRMSRFMTKRQGGVLLPATTFVVLQTTQSNVKSAGAGVALTYRAHAGLFYAGAAAGPLASAVRVQEDAEKSMSRTGRTDGAVALAAPASCR